MRLTTPLHSETRTAPSQGRGFEPKTSLTGLAVRLFGDTPSTAVSSTFSVYGQLKEGEGQRPFAPTPIPFGGASIISLSGTGTAQWEDRIHDSLYSLINVSLISLATLTSFQAAAVETNE